MGCAGRPSSASELTVAAFLRVPRPRAAANDRSWWLRFHGSGGGLHRHASTALHGWMDAGEMQSRLTCGGCGNTWMGLSRCHCSCCHQTFATVGVFDRHQVAARCIDPAQIPARRAGGIWFEDTGRDPAALFD